MGTSIPNFSTRERFWRGSSKSTRACSGKLPTFRLLPEETPEEAFSETLEAALSEAAFSEAAFSAA